MVEKYFIAFLLNWERTTTINLLEVGQVFQFTWVKESWNPSKFNQQLFDLDPKTSTILV